MIIKPAPVDIKTPQGGVRARKTPTTTKPSSPTLETSSAPPPTKKLRNTLLAIAALIVIGAIIGISVALTTPKTQPQPSSSSTMPHIKPDVSAAPPIANTGSTPPPVDLVSDKVFQPLVAGLQENFQYPRGLLVTPGSKWTGVGGKCGQDALVLPPGIKIPQVYSNTKMLKFVPGRNCMSVQRDFDVPFGVSNNNSLFFQFSAMYPRNLLDGQGVSFSLTFKNTPVIPFISLVQQGAQMVLKGLSSTTIPVTKNMPIHAVFRISRSSSKLNFYASLNPPLTYEKVVWTNFGTIDSTVIADADLIYGSRITISSLGEYPTPNVEEINIGDIRLHPIYSLVVIEDPRNTVQAVIMGGSNNADGRVSITDKTPEFVTNYRGRHVQGAMMYDANRGFFDYFYAGGNNNCYGSGTDLERKNCVAGPVWGSEIKLGNLLYNYYGKAGTALVLKYAVGGSKLVCNATELTWSANCPEAVSSDLKLYNRLLTHVLTANELMARFGWKVELKAFVFMQGENDALNTEITREIYQEELNVLIKRLREDLASPEMAFIVGRIGGAKSVFNPASKNFSPERQGGVLVRQAQDAVVSGGYKSKIVNTDGVGNMENLIDYNAAGVLKLSELFYAAMAEFL